MEAAMSVGGIFEFDEMSSLIWDKQEEELGLTAGYLSDKAQQMADKINSEVEGVFEEVKEFEGAEEVRDRLSTPLRANMARLTS